MILGPVTIEIPRGITVVPVTSASEMYEASMTNFENASGAILTAAVADYAPEIISSTKSKSQIAI